MEKENNTVTYFDGDDDIEYLGVGIVAFTLFCAFGIIVSLLWNELFWYMEGADRVRYAAMTAAGIAVMIPVRILMRRLLIREGMRLDAGSFMLREAAPFAAMLAVLAAAAVAAPRGPRGVCVVLMAFLSVTCSRDLFSCWAAMYHRTATYELLGGPRFGLTE